MKRAKPRKSSYVRHGKTPFQYSGTYNSWKAAAKRNDPDAMAQHADEHAKQFGYTRNVAPPADETPDANMAATELEAA